MQRLMLAVCAVLTIASVLGAAGAATAALTVTIVQPATNPSSAEVDETVAFEAVAFNDGQELEYANVQWLWQFGDATQSTNNPTSHAYVAAGDYTVTVTATFNQAQASATTHVIVEDDEETPKITGFDSSLSIYVGFRGHWINFATGQSEFAEIEAPVAVFQPGEQVCDDFEEWFSHLLNSPRIPAGWSFFSPDGSEPMEMHVIVRDTQDRLGDVLITDRATRADVGAITANTAGSRIDGYVEVSPTARYFTLSIRDKATAPMATAAANNLKIEDCFIFPGWYGFNPYRGDEHDCPIHALNGPYGNPTDLTDRVALEGGETSGYACAGVVVFTNDAAQSAQKTPKYDALMDKKILQEFGWTYAGLPLAVADEVQAKIDAVRALYTGGTVFDTPLLWPPYSKGDGHWGRFVAGHVHSLICVPYGGMSKHKVGVKGELTAGLDWRDGDGHKDPAKCVAAKATVTWGEENMGKWQIAPPIAVGDLFALTVQTQAAPALSPLEGITTPVTFTLMADKTPPDDEPGLIGGGATVTRLAAWTNPSPPAPMAPEQVKLTFPDTGDNKGTCTHELAKGFRYRVTFKDDGFHAGDPVEFTVPNTPDVEIEVELRVLVGLEIRTQRDGTPVLGYVQLKDPNNTIVPGLTEWDGTHYRLIRTCVRTLGDWQVRAKPVGGSEDDYGDWIGFTVEPSTITKVVTVDVPEGTPPPPPPP